MADPKLEAQPANIVEVTLADIDRHPGAICFIAWKASSEIISLVCSFKSIN